MISASILALYSSSIPVWRRDLITSQAQMEAKDGSIGFDMEGVFTAIQPQKSIQYNLTDGRKVNVEFSETPSGVLVHETFEAETENSTELQRVGWLSILDNFRRHVENK